MNKLIVVIMGSGKKHFARMSVDSVKDADEILYWTSNATRVRNVFLADGLYAKQKLKIFNNGWDEEDKATNGKCRQKYLDYLKENYPNDWCLVLDEDEIIEDVYKIKKFIKKETPCIFNVKMRHFIGDLGHEDSTHETHWVPNRLFHISLAKEYPLHSHPILNNEQSKNNCDASTVWHMGHLPIEYMDYINFRYKQHAKDSVIHNQHFLKQWKLSHLFGLYPNKQINPVELPQQICDRYEINKDEFYFANRGIEVKHFIMVKQWHDYFKNKSVLDIGCGRGPFLYAWTMFDIETFGFDKSSFAVKNSISPNSNMWIGDIIDKPAKKYNNNFDLVTAIDILEHIDYEDLDDALKNINDYSKKYVLFSIPFIGDPNLDADPTHKIKASKDWWLDKLSQYWNMKEVPADWLFAHQLLIGEKR